MVPGVTGLEFALLLLLPELFELMLLLLLLQCVVTIGAVAPTKVKPPIVATMGVADGNESISVAIELRRFFPVSKRRLQNCGLT